MQALLYTTSFELEVRAVPSPQPAGNEVVVRIEAAGICGSDLHGVASRSPRRAPPLIMGHELCGEVVAAGGPAGEPFIGTRVAVNPQVPCGDCLVCRSGRENICSRRELIGGTRPGGFAELVSVPLRCLHPISTDLAAGVAVFCEPLATCVHALRLVPDSLSEVAVVLGAGTIGVLAAQALRVAGTRVIVVSEVDGARRQACSDDRRRRRRPGPDLRLRERAERGLGRRHQCGRGRLGRHAARLYSRAPAGWDRRLARDARAGRRDPGVRSRREGAASPGLLRVHESRVRPRPRTPRERALGSRRLTQVVPARGEPRCLQRSACRPPAKDFSRRSCRPA